MLKWHDHYYVGESVRDESAVREKLDAGKPVPGIYLVTFSDNPHNILEIIPAVTLFQKTAARLCPEIVGMAKGMDEAMELVQMIVQTVYEETGDVLVEKYLKRHVTYLMDADKIDIDPSGNGFGTGSACFAAAFVLSCQIQRRGFKRNVLF